jgi:hypothetical protein
VGTPELIVTGSAYNPDYVILQQQKFQYLEGYGLTETSL